MDKISGLPRLYVNAPLAAGAAFGLGEDQAHYLKNVLRRQIGDKLRVFNAENGEFLAAITGISKKSMTITAEKSLRPAMAPTRRVHLIFPPLKKDPMDFMIEKSTELGVHMFHPVRAAQADMRTVQPDRLHAQMIEAAEQCERMDIPELAPLVPLETCLQKWPADIPVIAALERADAPLISALDPAILDARALAFLIGPAGGFSDAERTLLTRYSFVHAISLGSHILRAETAAIAMLSFIYLKGGK